MAGFGEPVEQPSRLRPIFALAVAGLVGNALWSTYAPDTLKEYAAEKVTDTTGISLSGDDAAETDGLKFVFTPQATLLMGEKAEGVMNDDTDTADKWHATMGRHTRMMQDPSNRANFKKWLTQFDHLKGGTIEEIAKGVDGAIDKQIVYASDTEVHRRRDYFASPMETIALGKGDCDDFSILKYYTLRYLGVPADRMMNMMVGTNNGRLDHMTLMVNTLEQGFLSSAWASVKYKLFDTPMPSNFTILDNDNSELGKLIEAKDANYRPFYGMNEQGIWSVPANSKWRW